MSTDSAAVHADHRAAPGHDQGHATTATPSTSPRASDAERADTVARLHEALGAGRLDLAETDERVAAAYAARHRHELADLLADLPAGDTAFTDAPRWDALWTLVGVAPAHRRHRCRRTASQRRPAPHRRPA